MRLHLALSLALLFIAFGGPSNAQNAAEPAPSPPTTTPSAADALQKPDPSMPIFYYDVSRTFSLNCTVPQPADGGSYVWKKNGTAVDQIWDLRDRYKLEEGDSVFRLTVRSTEDDFGNYSCAVGNGASGASWEVRGRPYAKMAHNTNVVEKQSLKLTCKLVGKPYPAVKWLFSNDTLNYTDVTEVLGSRVKLQRSEQGVEDGELVLSDAERSDAGVYNCSLPVGTPASSTLRVKDQYAALWPFLGICAEVFVLCAIILVYEKRRTKPELDDSDTDNHDQKKS